MHQLVRRIAIQVLTAVVLAGCFETAAYAAAETNENCPVLPDRPASDEITANYRGREVRFCCAHCRDEFLANPEVYENQLPQFIDWTWRDRVTAVFNPQARWWISGGLVSVLVVLRVRRWKAGPETVAAAAGAVPGMWNRRISPTIPLLVLTGILGYEVWSLREQVFWTQMEDEIHYATFYDFGFPPVPRKPEIPPTVTATYYRGNDERSDALFNGGNYRTSTFLLTLCDEDGQTINYGDEIAGRELFLKFEIDRPPHTPDFLYSDRVMERMFLTQHCERLLGREGETVDRLNLTATQPMQHWEARYPLGAFQEADPNRLRGLIYVCEAYYAQPHWWTQAESRAGSRFHYGVQFDLHFDDGRLAERSDIWMGALYRTRKFPQWKVPLSQWFSHEPIPEKPYETTEDPELLGIADHADRYGSEEK